MTSEDYDKLTTDEQECLVLTLWGWTNLQINDWAMCDESETGLKFRGDFEQHVDMACPDVLHDLNAMHEAHPLIARNELRAIRWLTAILKICGDWEQALNATAEQRAKAFALVMSLG